MPFAAVEAQIIIGCPRSEVFDRFSDRRARLRLLPDNFTDARLLDGPRSGEGARFTFTLRGGRGAYTSITEVVRCRRPETLVERTRDGETEYETSWRFDDEDGGTRTRVHVRMEYPRARGLAARLLDRHRRALLFG